MDDFREWLSDNLRYFMLGGGVLLILLVLIFGIRACAGGGNKENNNTTVTTTDTSVSETTETVSGGESGETTSADTDNSLTEASSEIRTLIESYYTALGNRDVDAIRAITVDLASEDESKIINTQDYIEGYTVSNVYTKVGLTDSTYVVFARFQYLCTGISTPVPALSQFYVITDTDGSLKINGSASSDASISAYITSLKSDSDVRALTAEVEAENAAAQESDPALKEFLEGLGESGNTSSSDSVEEEKPGTTYVATTSVNVRDSSGGGNVIGVLDYGQEVQVLGFSGEWAQIDYNGETAYVYAEYLSQVSDS